MDDSILTPDLTGSVVSERTRLRIPSRPECIPAVVELLKEKARLCGACHESRAGKLVLALHEALTNAIVHGNLEVTSELKERDDDSFARTLAERAANPHLASRSVTIDVDHDPDRCRWSIADEGKGFDFMRYLRREPDDESLWLCSGRGIMLMRAFVDDIYYEQGGRKVTLTLFRTSGVEKRLEPRHSVQQRVHVAPVRADGSVDWEAAYDAVTQNVSASGAGVLQAHLASADRVLLGVEVQGRTVYVPAQVRRCRQPEEGMVELGCQFLPNREFLPTDGPRPSVEEAIRMLLEHSHGPPRNNDERRAHPRAPYTERIEVSGVADLGLVAGFARDLSRGGISFISRVALPLGDCVVTLPRRDLTPVSLSARVVRCVEMTPGFYDVGARFLSVNEWA